MFFSKSNNITHILILYSCSHSSLSEGEESWEGGQRGWQRCATVQYSKELRESLHPLDGQEWVMCFIGRSQSFWSPWYTKAHIYCTTLAWLCVFYPASITALLCFPSELMHIKQSERITIGLNGNLYFANVLISNTRDDYTCYTQYIEARTILSTEPVALTVHACE